MDAIAAVKATVIAEADCHLIEVCVSFSLESSEQLVSLHVEELGLIIACYSIVEAVVD